MDLNKNNGDSYSWLRLCLELIRNNYCYVNVLNQKKS